jgi:two-component system cell cycle response regulator DivK
MKPVILVIEDDPVTLQFYKYIFEFAGIELIVSEDGDNILKILDEQKVNLIIMDINLKNTSIKGKRTDGVEFSKIIKENDKTSEIPVVLVSAFNLNILNDDSFKRSKADHYIMKPITDFNKFLNEIRMMLK